MDQLVKISLKKEASKVRYFFRIIHTFSKIYSNFCMLIMSRPETRRAEFKRIQQLGVKGVKRDTSKGVQKNSTFAEIKN